MAPHGHHLFMNTLLDSGTETNLWKHVKSFLGKREISVHTGQQGYPAINYSLYLPLLASFPFHFFFRFLYGPLRILYYCCDYRHLSIRRYRSFQLDLNHTLVIYRVADVDIDFQEPYIS